MAGIEPPDSNKARISRNVDKMMAAGAPQSEIEQYIQSEGLKPVGQPDNQFADVESGSSSQNDASDYGPYEATVNGLTGGFAGEIGAALRSRSLFRGPEYSRELAMQEEGARRYSREHPVANFGAEALGMAIPAVLSGGANLAGRLGIENVVGRAAINQGAIGALYGAGNAGEGSRTKGALIGGTVGGALGAGAHLGLKALQAAAEITPGVNKVGRALGMLPKPTEKADALILKRMAQDETTPVAIRADVLSRPDTKPETLLDMGGGNVTSLGKLAVNSPGKGRAEFQRFAAERQAAAPERVSEDLTTAGMNPVNRYESAEALREAKQKVAKPLYEAALQGNPIDDDVINAWLETPEGHAAFRIAQGIRRKEAEALAIREGRAVTPKDYALPEIYKMHVGEPTPVAPGTAVVHYGSGLGMDTPLESVGEIRRVGVPDDRTLHYLKLALDDGAKYGYVPPGGTASTKNYFSKDLVGAFRKRIGELIPGYDEAASTYSAGQHMEDAFNAGGNFLKNEGAKTAHEIAQMTPYEKELFRYNAGASVRNAADRVGDRGDIADRVFGSPFKRKQIAAALDDPAAFDALSKEMARESRMAAVNRLQGGSHTAPIQMEGADAARALGILSSLAGGNIGGAAWRMTQRLGNGMTPEVTDAVSARLLSGQGGRGELLSALAALTDAQRAKLSKSGALASLVAAITGGTAGSIAR